ncbi:MAG: 6-pyruvoyl-tetrahydropterin synthase-related protein [Nanoarchaeota archaeon]
MDNGHYLHEQTFFAYNYKSSFEDGTLPFWTPYWYSGQPLYGDGQIFFFNLTHIFMIMLKNIFLAITLSTLMYFFIGGLGMYLLAKYLIGSRSAAFVSAIIFMFNGLIYRFITGGNPSILEPYSLMPLIFLCILKARKASNPVNYSILAGILLAFQIYSGGAQVFIYTILLIGLYIAFSAISRNFTSNLIKIFIIGSVALIVFFGVAAVKLLPGFDFIKKTNRAYGVSYQEYVGGDKFVFRDFFKTLVFNKPYSSVYFGVTAFALALTSLAQWRKRMVLFLVLASIFTLLLGSGGIISKLFFDYAPVFSQTRHIGRVLFVFVFAVSMLAGYGYSHVAELLTKKFSVSRKIKNALFCSIVFLILIELVAAKGLPKGFNIKDQLEQNELAKYLQQQKGKFRITTFDVTDFVSFYGSSYYAQYGLETLSGGGGVWINDIIKYTAVAKNYNFSKLSGILNLKYATSTEKIDAHGFKLTKKFEECIPCNETGWTYWIDGPFLYENDDFLPRYYLVDNAVLVVGEPRQSEDIIYYILLNKNFNPKTTAIIQGKEKIKEYSINFLKRFNGIILASAFIDQESLQLLEQYKAAGGKILPDVLNRENTLEISLIENFLGSLEGNLIEVDSRTISANEIELMPKNSGFLVLSERFSGFDDWSAVDDNEKIDILKANGIISAVYVNKPGAVKFMYYPKSFHRGLLISLSTILIIFIYSIFIFKRKWGITKEAG